MLVLLSQIGTLLLSYCSKVGESVIFAGQILKQVIYFRVYYKNLVRDFIEISFYSLVIVALTSTFTGAVLTIHTQLGLEEFSDEKTLSHVVSVSIVRELGPVLIGIIIAAKTVTSTAAEISSMKITEQIDALRSFGISPYTYIIFPRILASSIAFPMLAIVTDIVGIYGSYLTATTQLGYNNYQYAKYCVSAVSFHDLHVGLVKSFIFGMLSSFIGCYYGFFSQRNTNGIAMATTGSIVMSLVIILSADYLITLFFIYE
ncbi:MAG: putative membrane protein [Candidatus Xenolissoclinum pacificiensis L6]|uniref:Membrane protein n=1 Tax=Candidatus Xenolissoclinum pacificiensis L6 TaxID=1401685 RepID=W2V0H3_9RICK|nr:MAG: putative membrane protein [Candidatus Xenolissoclinum pacificiensis L6]